jgi:hypothetical protein
MIATKLRPPIFLIGNYRSGTTITQNLIGLHPDVVTWYEPRTLWLYADPGRHHDEFAESDATEKVIRYIRGRFHEFQLRNGDRQIMENTPSNILRVPYVHEIFPEAIYLYITRNPFSCISSMELKWQRTKTLKGLKRTLGVTPKTQLHYYLVGFVKQIVINKVFGRKYTPIYGPRYKGIEQDLKDYGKLKIIARQWARGNRKAREDLAKLGNGRVLTCRYEDLMQDTETTLRRIYHHCGLVCSDDIVRAANDMNSCRRSSRRSRRRWLSTATKSLRCFDNVWHVAERPHSSRLADRPLIEELAWRSNGRHGGN